MSKLLRRSGIAAVHIARLIEWEPKTVVQAGVGLNWREVDCMVEVWPDIHFIGFEPNPYLFKKLKNKYPGTVAQVALSDKPGSATLSYRSRHKDGSTLNQLREKEDEPTQKVQVLVDTLDIIFPDIVNLPKPILFWLDVEGSELKVLQGGNNFLKHIDVINVEMTGKPPGAGWCKPWEVHDKLIAAGFVLQYLHTFRSHSGQYDAVYVRPELFRLEYSCSPCRCKDCGG